MRDKGQATTNELAAEKRERERERQATANELAAEERERERERPGYSK